MYRTSRMVHVVAILVTLMAWGGGVGSALAQAPETYVFQHGDTLWDLSVSHYGDPSVWRDLKSLNGIADEHAIADGTKIILPSKDQLMKYHNASTQAQKDQIRQQILGGTSASGSPSAPPSGSKSGSTPGVADPIQGLTGPDVASKKGG